MTLLQYSIYFSEMGITMACLGDKKKGHLPAKCSIRIATNLSTEPRIALWIITGLAKPGFRGCSNHVKSSSSSSSLG
jgi:hypothetical protein